MKDTDVETRIQHALDTIQPEPFAAERVRQRIQEKQNQKQPKRSRSRWIARLAPVCLFAVLTAASSMIIGRALQAKQPANTDSERRATELATIPDLYGVRTDELVTACGAVWRRTLDGFPVQAEPVGTASFATDETLDGCQVYAAQDGHGVAVAVPAGEMRSYAYFGEFFGTSDGEGGVVDDMMSDWLAANGMTDAGAIEWIRLRDPQRDVETKADGLVTKTMYRKEVTDRAAIQTIYDHLAGFKRDMAAYQTACQLDAPYTGAVTVTLKCTSGWTFDLVCYPKIGFLWGGYQTNDAFWTVIQSYMAD